MPGKTKNSKQSPDFLKRVATVPTIELFLLLGIFILAVVVRVYADPNIPYHYDPGKNIVYARAALEWFPLVPQYNAYFNLGEYYEYQVLFPYLVAFFHKISAVSLVTITTWLAVISGAALTITVYFLTDEIAKSKPAALFSAFLIAASEIQILQYVNYYPQILAMTLMPLALVFLIRYIRSQEFKFFILTVVVSSLVILSSYLVGLVYSVIVLISLAIWCYFDRKTVKILIFVPVVTALLLTFFWLPVVWRHGVSQFLGAALSIIFDTTGTFTNQPWTLTSFLSYSVVALIAIGAGIVAIIVLKRLKWENFRWDFPRILLVVWLVVSFALMASYLVRPILWVDRFSPFLDIALLICAGIALYLVINAINAVKTGPKYKGYLLLILLLIPLLNAVNPGVVFGKWGYPSDFATIDYMEQNLPPDVLVVAPPSIDGFWVSALSGVRILGGETSQLMGREYSGDRDSYMIINSPDTEEKMALIRNYGVNYIFLPVHEDVPGVWNPEIDQGGIDGFSNDTYFIVEQYYRDYYGYTALIKVREDLPPQYHEELINWTVTTVGYLISCIVLGGLLYLHWSRKTGKGFKVPFF